VRYNVFMKKLLLMLTLGIMSGETIAVERHFLVTGNARIYSITEFQPSKHTRCFIVEPQYDNNSPSISCVVGE